MQNVAELQQLNADLMSERGSLVKTIERLIEEIELLKSKNFISDADKKLIGTIQSESAKKHEETLKSKSQ